MQFLTLLAAARLAAGRALVSAAAFFFAGAGAGDLAAALPLPAVAAALGLAATLPLASPLPFAGTESSSLPASSRSLRPAGCWNSSGLPTSKSSSELSGVSSRAPRLFAFAAGAFFPLAATTLPRAAPGTLASSSSSTSMRLLRAVGLATPRCAGFVLLAVPFLPPVSFAIFSSASCFTRVVALRIAALSSALLSRFSAFCVRFRLSFTRSMIALGCFLMM